MRRSEDPTADPESPPEPGETGPAERAEPSPAESQEAGPAAPGESGPTPQSGREAAGDAARTNAEINDTLDKVNPKYEASKSAYSENCTGVAQAYELRRRGIDAEAGPLEKPLRSSEGGPGGRPLTAITQPWGDHFTPGTKADIENAFKDPGSRGIVFIAWNTGGAHVFNVENVDGSVRFVDGQPTPSVRNASHYFGLGTGTRYLRLDGLATPAESSTKQYVERRP